MKISTIIGLCVFTFIVLLTAGIIQDVAPRNRLVETTKYQFRDYFKFKFKNQDFVIHVEPIYADINMDINDIYINNELACRTYRLKKIFKTVRYVDVKNNKPEDELYEIIKYADEVYWKERFRKKDKNDRHSYFD